MTLYPVDAVRFVPSQHDLRHGRTVPGTAVAVPASLTGAFSVGAFAVTVGPASP